MTTSENRLTQFDPQQHFGRNARDLLTGFEGRITCYAIHVTGCDTVTLEPPITGDTEKIGRVETFDMSRIAFVDESTVEIVDGLTREDIEHYQQFLGREAEDPITGFKGRILSIAFWYGGRLEASIQPPAKEGDRKLPPGYWMQFGRLDITDAEAITLQAREPATAGAGNAPTWKPGADHRVADFGRLEL